MQKSGKSLKSSSELDKFKQHFSSKIFFTIFESMSWSFVYHWQKFAQLDLEYKKNNTSL